MALLVVERQRPEPRRGRDAADDHVAAPVDRPFAVIRCCREGDAVAGSDRQFAAGRDRRAGIRIDVGGGGLGPGGPGTDRERAEIGAAGRRHPGGAEADDGGQDQRQQGDEDQPHGGYLRGKGLAAASPGTAAAKLSGNASEFDDTGLPGFTGSPDEGFPAVLAASSSIFSTRTRISAPRLVRIGGGPRLIAGGVWAPLAATGPGIVRPRNSFRALM